MLSDTANIILSEGLDEVRNYLEVHGKIIKVTVFMIVIVMISPFFAEMLWEGILALIGLIILITTTSLLSNSLIIFEKSIIDVWRAYLHYKLRGLRLRGLSRDTYEGFLEIKISIARAFIKLLIFILIYLLSVIYFTRDTLSLFFKIVAVYFLASGINEILFPKIKFLRPSIMKRQRELYKTLRNSTFIQILIVTLILFFIIDGGIILSDSDLLLSLLEGGLVLFAGIIIGKMLLNWYKILFEVKVRPIESSPIIWILPFFLSSAGIVYSRDIIRIFDLSPTLEIAVSIILASIIVPAIYYMNFLDKELTDLISWTLSHTTESETERESEVIIHDMANMKRSLRGLVLSELLIVIMITILYLQHTLHASFLRIITIDSIILPMYFLLGILLGLTKFSRNILNYCLESLIYEQKKVHAYYQRILEERIRRRKKEVTLPSEEELKDFEEILRDLERILGEEEY